MVSRQEKGAVFIEAAITLIVFFLFIFAIIDFSRFTLARGLMRFQANSSLNMAAVLPELTSTDGGVRAAAKQRIRDTVLSGLSDSMIKEVTNVNLGVLENYDSQTPDDRMELERKLAEQPITIQLTATVEPLVLRMIPSFPITVSVQGFREPYAQFSQPKAVGCEGADLGVQGGNAGAFGGNTCACPYSNDPRAMRDSRPGQPLCRCTNAPFMKFVQNPGTDSGSCQCSGQATPKADGSGCGCNITCPVSQRKVSYQDEQYQGTCFCEGCGDLGMQDPGDSTKCVCGDADYIRENFERVCGIGGAKAYNTCGCTHCLNGNPLREIRDGVCGCTNGPIGQLDEYGRTLDENCAYQCQNSAFSTINHPTLGKGCGDPQCELMPEKCQCSAPNGRLSCRYIPE